jgi:hypothetical protein
MSEAERLKKIWLDLKDEENAIAAHRRTLYQKQIRVRREAYLAHKDYYNAVVRERKNAQKEAN